MRCINCGEPTLFDKGSPVICDCIRPREFTGARWDRIDISLSNIMRFCKDADDEDEYSALPGSQVLRRVLKHLISKGDLIQEEAQELWDGPSGY